MKLYQNVTTFRWHMLQRYHNDDLLNFFCTYMKCRIQVVQRQFMQFVQQMASTERHRLMTCLILARKTRRGDFSVVDFNVLLDETDNEATDVSAPVAEWMSNIITPSGMLDSRKACLLVDFYPNKDMFHYVSFEMTYRSADDAGTVKKKRLLTASDDGLTDRVADLFELSVDSGVSRYQVTVILSC